VREAATTRGPLRVVSHGGGVQSTALLVLAAHGRIPHRTFLFANVGSDSEHPGTLRYIAEVARPFAEANGIQLVELRSRRRDGTEKTIYGEITRRGSRRELIPHRLTNGMPGRRSCTAEFKIEVIRRWLKANGATAECPAHVAIGFSVDEVQRVARRRENEVERPEYPLIELGLARDDCVDVIAAAGLPVPERSACWFCPFHRAGYWAELRRDEPELFERAARLEALMNRRRRASGRPPAWLTRHGRPLEKAVEAAPGPVSPEGPETCDEGHCWT
jgi:hypothetical protein